jgi:hypothetical protein
VGAFKPFLMLYHFLQQKIEDLVVMTLECVVDWTLSGKVLEKRKLLIQCVEATLKIKQEHFLQCLVIVFAEQVQEVSVFIVDNGVENPFKLRLRDLNFFVDQSLPD